MLIKPALRSHLTSVSIDITPSPPKPTNAGENVGKEKPFFVASGNVNSGSQYRNQHGDSSRNCKQNQPPHELATPLLGTYSKDSRSTCHRDVCTSIFIATLFRVAKTGNQHRSPSILQWIKKM